MTISFEFFAKSCIILFLLFVGKHLYLPEHAFDHVLELCCDEFEGVRFRCSNPDPAAETQDAKAAGEAHQEGT